MWEKSKHTSRVMSVDVISVEVHDVCFGTSCSTLSNFSGYYVGQYLGKNHEKVLAYHEAERVCQSVCILLLSLSVRLLGLSRFAFYPYSPSSRPQSQTPPPTHFSSSK